MQIPGLGKLERVARHSNSAYGFVNSLKTEHPEYREFTIEEVLLRIRDKHPKLEKQFPWLSYPV